MLNFSVLIEKEVLYKKLKDGGPYQLLVPVYLNKRGNIWELSLWTSAPKSFFFLPLGCLNPSAK